MFFIIQPITVIWWDLLTKHEFSYKQFNIKIAQLLHKRKQLIVKVTQILIILMAMRKKMTTSSCQELYMLCEFETCTTHFWLIFLLYTHWKSQNFGFLEFTEGIKWQLWNSWVWIKRSFSVSTDIINNHF